MAEATDGAEDGATEPEAKDGAAGGAAGAEDGAGGGLHSEDKGRRSGQCCGCRGQFGGRPAQRG